MSPHEKPGHTRQFGIWIAIIALCILMLGWIMQAYSLMDWESALELGLQNESFTGGEAEQSWALESLGVAMADLIWALPLTVVALVGIIKRRFYGLACGLMALSVGVYFPLVFAFQRWETFQETAITALLLWTFPSLLGIIVLFTKRKEFI